MLRAASSVRVPQGDSELRGVGPSTATRDSGEVAERPRSAQERETQARSPAVVRLAPLEDSRSHFPKCSYALRHELGRGGPRRHWLIIEKGSRHDARLPRKEATESASRGGTGVDGAPLSERFFCLTFRARSLVRRGLRVEGVASVVTGDFRLSRIISGRAMASAAREEAARLRLGGCRGRVAGRFAKAVRKAAPSRMPVQSRARREGRAGAKVLR